MIAPMLWSRESYFTARGQSLSVWDALRAALAYATAFVSIGDADVMFVVSGGRMHADGQPFDSAIWADWIAAWQGVEAERDQGLGKPALGDPRMVDMQHGYRAFLVFLERHYEPLAETPMSRVLADCESALSRAPDGTTVWTRWLNAVTDGVSADVEFRLTPPPGLSPMFRGYPVALEPDEPPE